MMAADLRREMRRDGRLDTCTAACESVPVLDVATRRLVTRVMHDALLHEDAGAEYGWTPAGRWEHAGVMVDVDRREATMDGRPVDLTPTELRLLAILTRLRGAVATDELLLARLWGPGYEKASKDTHERRDPNRRLVRVNVARLRAKLGDRLLNGKHAKPEYRLIRTIPHVGYRLADEAPS